MSDSESPPAWPLLASELENEYPVYEVRRDRVRSPRTGEERDFHIVVLQDAVVVVALTDDDRAVLVEQYRHGPRSVTLEFPGGMLEGDDPAAAARRELREETGYEAESVTHLGAMELNPSWARGRVHVALATGARPAGPKEQDEGEDTRVRLVPLDEVREMVGTGELGNAVAIAALAIYEARREVGARGGSR